MGLIAPIDFLIKMTKDKIGVVSGAAAFVALNGEIAFEI
jgi:hypothetical protein